MSVETLSGVLGWSILINYGVLLIWWAVFVAAHDWMHQLHGRWFRLSAEDFDRIHYAGMAGFKVLILVFNLTPYLALRIVS